MVLVYILLSGLVGAWSMTWLYLKLIYVQPSPLGVDGITQANRIAMQESKPMVVELLNNTASRNDYIVDGEMVYYKGNVSLGDVVKIADDKNQVGIHKYKVIEIYKDGFCDLLNTNDKLPINLRRGMEHRDRLVVFRGSV